MEDKQRFREYMVFLGEIYNKKISKIIIKMYWEILKPFPDKQCIKAFNIVSATCKFFPKPVEIIEAIQGNKKEIEQKAADKALTQANIILQHLRKCGASAFPEGVDKISTHLMQTRWPYKQWAAHVFESELKWWVKEFCEAYIALIGVELQPQIQHIVDIKQLTKKIGGKL